MKPELKQYFALIIGLTVVAVIINLFVEFPFGLIAAIVLYVLTPKITKVIMGKKLAKAGIFTMGNLPQTKIEKYCMACGQKTTSESCNRCGSRRFTMR